jgi:curved DNA-binding protein
VQYRDYYRILGITRGAGPEEIKQAFRRLARKYHPDVSSEPFAETRFKEINEAHEVLSNPSRRADYDALGAHWRSGQEFTPPPDWREGPANRDSSETTETTGTGGTAGTAESGREGFSDFFQSLFGGARRRTRQEEGLPRDRSPAATSTVIEIDLDEAIEGTEVVLYAEGLQQRIRIPAGAQHGQRLRVPGKHLHPRLAHLGDVLLEIQIRPDPRYRLEGRNLLRDIPITPWESALGATIAVPTPRGQIRLTIPAGSHSGKEIRLRGLGLPGTPAGDLVIRLMIQTPPADLAREWYEHMARHSDFRPRDDLED